MLLLAIGQNEGFANLIRRVHDFEDVGHRFGLLHLPESAPAVIGKQVQEYPSIRLLSALPTQDDVLLEFEVVLEHEVIDNHFPAGGK